MGASATQTSVFKNSAFAALKREKSNLPSKYGSLLAFFEKFGAQFFDTWGHNYEVWKNFTSLATSSNTTWVPEEPPIAKNVTVTAEAWLKMANEKATCVAYTLGNITDLLVPDLIPSVPALALAAKRAVLWRYLASGDYCKKLDPPCGVATSQPAWKRMPPMMEPRSRGTAALVGRTVYFTDGAEQGLKCSPGYPNPNSGIAVDVDTNKWKTIPARPKAAAGAATAVVGKLVLSAGGTPDGLSACVADAYLFDPSRMEWSSAGAMRNARCDAQAVAVLSDVFIMGGGDVGSTATEQPITGAVEMYRAGSTPPSWVTKAPMPTPRTQFAAAPFGTEIYTFGGTVDGQNATMVCEIYQSEDNTWRTCTQPLPADVGARVGAQAVVGAGGRIVLLGGALTYPAGPRHMHATAFVFDPSPGARSWSQLPGMYDSTTQGLVVAVPHLFNKSRVDLHYFGGAVDQGNMAIGNNPFLSASHSMLFTDAPPTEHAHFDPTEAPPLPDEFVAAERGRAARVAAPYAQAKQPDDCNCPFTAPRCVGRCEPNGVLGWMCSSCAAQATVVVDSDARVGASTSSAPIFPGVGYLGYGYNLIKANPLAGALGDVADTGWSSSAVLDITCADCFEQQRVHNGKRVPDGISVNTVESCTLTTDTAVISDGVLLQEPVEILQNTFFRSNALHCTATVRILIPA